MYKNVNSVLSNNKEDFLKRLRQYVCKQYINFSEEEEKKNKHQYGSEQCKNHVENEKQRLVEYIKN